jgi:hypothetical protein
LMGGGRADSSSCSHSSKKKRSYSLGNEGYNLAVKMKSGGLVDKIMTPDARPCPSWRGRQRFPALFLDTTNKFFSKTRSKKFFEYDIY